MKRHWMGILGAVLAALFMAQALRRSSAQTKAGADAQGERGPYARIAILRPNDAETVDFEAGYIRHLDWHRQAKDAWSWYGWSIWAGERQRWFVYATFGHSAASLDSPVNPPEDERDSLLNVMPHAQFLGSGLYEFLPAISRGAGEPQATGRLEFTTVDLMPGAATAFETALHAEQSSLRAETLWYRMIAGGTVPRYVRLRPRVSLSAILEDRAGQPLPDVTKSSIVRSTIEIMNLRPTMCYGVSQPRQ
jgi:hypothetical protein